MISRTHRALRGSPPSRDNDIRVLVSRAFHDGAAREFVGKVRHDEFHHFAIEQDSQGIPSVAVDVEECPSFAPVDSR